MAARKTAKATKDGTTIAKLAAGQRALIEKYTTALRIPEGTYDVFNVHFDAFRSLVLSIPACKDFATSDVTSIVVDSMLKFLPPRSGASTVAPSELVPEVANYIAEFLESLPRKYVVQFTLPSMPFWGDLSLSLGREAALNSKRTPVEREIRNALVKALLKGEDQPEPAVSLEFTLKGFASTSLDSQGVAEAIALAKQVSFLLAYIGLAKTSTWKGIRSRARLLDRKTNEERGLNLPDRLALHLGGLEPNEEKLKLWEPGKTLLGGTQRPAATDEERVEVFESEATVIQRFFARSHLPGFSRIAAAIEWYQDSLLDEDQTMAFLAACIGLESIFGEDGMNELSRRLVDRYSFMLGKDRADRAQLAQDFDAVLDIRGKLVHARSSRLKAGERVQLSKVREMLWSSIRHELKPFLAADDVRLVNPRTRI